VIADQNGLLSAQTASAAIFTTQQVVSTAGQTTFPITNGYSTGYVTVFVNGTKLSADEYVDTSGTNIIFLTGSTAGDTVEFQKYLPAAGVSNNTLRSTNYFTATLGQTNFTVNYTPGLLDVFYNGAKLDNTEYTAANGTSITLATGSNAGDRLEVDVYSYQVGAFSGIGGTGAANQLAYFNTSNSITGSNAFTVSGSAIIITGSLIVSGSGTLINIGPTVFSGSVTSTAGFSGSFSGNADSASLAQNSLLLQGTGSVGFATTSSFATASGSVSTRITQIENVYATTGSNSFRANQSITGSLVVSSTITAQTLVVQTITSSIEYSSGSNIFGSQLTNTQTFTGSVNITGSITQTGTNATSSFAGYVGIGTTNPRTYKLAVVNSGSNAYIGVSNQGTADGDRTLRIGFGGSGANTYAEIQGTKLNISDDINIALQPGGGNVGIGTTNPAAQLEVTSTTGGTLRLKRDDGTVTTDESLGTLEFYTNDGDGPHVAAYVRGLGADLSGQNFGRFGAMSFGVSKTANTDAVEAMRIDLTGAVGIGTTSPTSLLEAAAAQNGQTSIRVRNSTSGTAASVEFGAYTNSGNGGFGKYSTGTTAYKNITAASTYIYNGTSGDIGLLNDAASGNISFAAGASSTAQMFISGSGYVGIGTTNPGMPLELYIADGSGLRLKNAGSSDKRWDLAVSGNDLRINETGVSAVVSIKAGGSVGIGTTSPNATLHVAGSTSIIRVGPYFAVNDRDFIELQADGASTKVYSPNEDFSFYNPVGNANITGSTVNICASSGTNFRTTAGGSTNLGVYAANATGANASLYMECPGQFGAGFYTDRASSTFRGWCGSSSLGVSLAGNGTSWGSFSDERMKDIIEPITNALDKVNTLRTVIGKYKTDEADKRRVFLIAQDVQAVLPEAVYDDNSEDKMLSLQYTDIIPLLTKAIQEQNVLIKELQAKLQRNNIN
jgi:hypothetical protein